MVINHVLVLILKISEIIFIAVHKDVLMLQLDASIHILGNKRIGKNYNSEKLLLDWLNIDVAGIEKPAINTNNLKTKNYIIQNKKQHNAFSYT